MKTAALVLITFSMAQIAAAQAPQNMKLTWVDRSGKTIETVGTSAPYIGPDLSPDGKHIAIHRHEGDDGGDVWLLESGPGAGTRLTGDGSNKEEISPPIWSWSTRSRSASKTSSPRLWTWSGAAAAAANSCCCCAISWTKPP